MRKFVFIFVFLFITILRMQNIKADYECFYKASRNQLGFKIDESDSFKVSTINNKFEFDTFLGLANSPVVADPKINSKWSEETLIKDYLKGCCPNEFYVCRGEMGIPGGTKTLRYFVILNGSLYSELNWINGKVASIDGFAFTKDYCMIAQIDEDKTNVCTKNIEFGCELYDDYEKILREQYCEFGSENCDFSNIDQYKKAKEKIKSFCKTTLENSDYGINPCVSKCISLENLLNEIENKQSSNDACGFSGKLMSYIANIVKWLKYIIPVIVIVLGILDFIKAIASEKDDEMKKAQGHFVKRLIAAALIFIIPVIIEFVLDKMGFDANGCGIIDL